MSRSLGQLSILRAAMSQGGASTAFYRSAFAACLGAPAAIGCGPLCSSGCAPFSRFLVSTIQWITAGDTAWQSLALQRKGNMLQCMITYRLFWFLAIGAFLAIAALGTAVAQL